MNLMRIVRTWSGSKSLKGLELIGGAEGNRTPDLVIANDALSQLSYGPEPWEYGAASNVREGPIWEAAYYGFAGPTVNRPAGERDWPRRGPRAKLGEPPRKGPGSCRH